MKVVPYSLAVLALMACLACGAEPGVTLSRREEPAAGQGYRRTALIEADHAKYPVRCVVETYGRDPLTGESHLVKRTRMVGDHVIVKLRPQATRHELEHLNARLGTVTRRALHTPRLFLVAVTSPDLDTVPRLVDAYNAETNIVAYAEPDFLVELHDTSPTDPYFPGSLWGHVKIQCPAAWDYVTGTGGVVVAVIDTGIDYTHEDLAANMWMNPGETGIDGNGVGMATNGIDDDANGYIDDVYGWNFNADTRAVMDGHSHGTRCSGTIGAVGNNAKGVVGVCWNVKLMAIKLWSDAGKIGPVSDVVDSFHYVATMRSNGVNVRITSNSWSTEEYAQSMEDAIRANRDAGILCVGAVANENVNIDAIPEYPSCFDLDNVISVAGTTESDGKYPSSSYGVTNVDVGAPAVNIWTTGLNNSYLKSLDGTSRSAPFVAGVAALLWDLMPSLTYAEVRQAIFDGVDQVAALDGKVATGGRLNAYKALLQVKPAILHTPLINTTNTTGSYAIDAELLPRPLLPPGRQWVCWNTDGATNAFATNALVRMTNDTYSASVPAQPLGTRLHYYLRAETTNGLVETSPTNAPGAMHTFQVVEGVPLTVAGTPPQVGLVTPDYGSSMFPSGVVVSISAQRDTPPEDGRRYAVDGWNGSGSVPSAGASNVVVFPLLQPSTCEWVWSVQYGLWQTSSVAGLLDTTTWWYASATGMTVAAASPVWRDGTNYGFAGWYIDGARQPDATSAVVNPATTIAMSTPRFARAWYLPETTDMDVDQLPDYWEFAYFGNLSSAWTNDHDGDGLTDGGELVAGTDPTDFEDVLAITSIGVTNAGTNILIQWPSVSNRTYSIRVRADLLTGDWSAVTGGIPAVVPANVVTAPFTGEAVMFYRVGVE